MDLAKLTFQTKGKEYDLDLNKFSERISRMENFPNSTRIFEDFFANVKHDLDLLGDKTDGPKGIALEVQALNKKAYIALDYTGNAREECLQIVVKDVDYYKHMGLVRTRNALGVEYKTEIPKGNTLKDNFLDFLYGEFQPDGFFTMDEGQKVKDNRYFHNK